jgi:pimeloyl-ACP methyl ester carboxylesterase
MKVNRAELKAENETFDAIFFKAKNPVVKILFAAGSGGNPQRHLPLLDFFAEHSCEVIAPYFERIFSPSPTAAELLLRVSRMRAALNFISDSEVPVVGIGHSIGATLLAAMAGAQMWMRSAELLPITQDERLRKLVLMTPPTGFFNAPSAFESVPIPMQVWAGTLDTITPPQQAELLRNCLAPGLTIDFHCVEGAGHFSFMNTLPPNIGDPMIDREAFLLKLSQEILRFISE